VTYRIAQISDTHLSDDKPFFVANFQLVASHLATDRPDLVVNTGDMALDGATQASDLEAARRLHEAIPLPLRFIPGNHDVGDSQDAPFHGLPAISHERRERYLSVYGSDYWLIDAPGWRIIAVDAQLLASDLAAAGAQLEFIAAASAGRGARRIALFVHKPLFHLMPGEEAITGRFVNPAPRRQLLEALGEPGPTVVASGHVHQHLAEPRPGAQHVWAPSTGFILPDSRQPRYGAKEVGYVEHLFEPDGSHSSRFVPVPDLVTHSIEDFPQAYDLP
jgi:3',5'-cyclic AMP phosphodiesterase CpdA